jgi:hypothetical protein
MAWSINKPIPDQTSKASPALAGHRDRLHMVHLGNSSNTIWHSWFDGTKWTPNRRIPGQTSQAPPALSVFNDRLVMLHLGNASDSIWYSHFDGQEWTANGRLPYRSSARPALLANLVLYLESPWSGRIFEGQLVGDGAIEGELVPDQTSKASPALGWYRPLEGQQEVHMVHLGRTSNTIWHSTRLPTF